MNPTLQGNLFRPTTPETPPTMVKFEPTTPETPPTMVQFEPTTPETPPGGFYGGDRSITPELTEEPYDKNEEVIISRKVKEPDYSELTMLRPKNISEENEHSDENSKLTKKINTNN